MENPNNESSNEPQHQAICEPKKMEGVEETDFEFDKLGSCWTYG